MQRGLPSLLVLLGTFIFALPDFGPWDQLEEYKSYLFFLAATLNGSAAFIEYRRARPTERERELQTILDRERRERKQTERRLVGRRNAELTAHHHLLRTITDIQVQNRHFTLSVIKKTDRAERWEHLCDHALGAVAKAWRAQYFPKQRGVRVRCTLFAARENELHPLRRSSGAKQSDPAVTVWNAGEGVAGAVLRTGETAYIPSVAKELALAKSEQRDPEIAIKGDRPDHAKIQSLICEGISNTDGGLLAVLSIDANYALPEIYEERTPLPDHPIAFIQALTTSFATIAQYEAATRTEASP